MRLRQCYTSIHFVYLSSVFNPRRSLSISPIKLACVWPFWHILYVKVGKASSEKLNSGVFLLHCFLIFTATYTGTFQGARRKKAMFSHIQLTRSRLETVLLRLPMWDFFQRTHMGTKMVWLLFSASFVCLWLIICGGRWKTFIFTAFPTMFF